MESIETADCLVGLLRQIFVEEENDWAAREIKIANLLRKVNLKADDISQFVSWNTEKAYTRNLISLDKNFALLLLCWNPSRESKIHNHPCDGCFVKVVQGVLRETRYSISGTDHIEQTSEQDFSHDEQTLMNDSIGLHKIGNPTAYGSISLHVYTPPFEACKTWCSMGKSADFLVAKTCEYDTYCGRPSSSSKPPDASLSSSSCLPISVLAKSR